MAKATTTAERISDLGRWNHVQHHSADICAYEDCDRGICPEMRELAASLAVAVSGYTPQTPEQAAVSAYHVYAALIRWDVRCAMQVEG